MRKYLVFTIILLIGFMVSAQEENEEGLEEIPEFSKKTPEPAREFTKKKGKEKPPISDYKIINIHNDTTFVDTTLTIRRDYNFNYLRKDDFGLQPINNVGQTYNSLVKVEEYDHLLPLFGARARHFNFMEAEDINYYQVPTPLTELYFKTTFEQGQQLDAFITINTSPRFNLSVAYKGVRSLGKYQNALTSTGNFRSTASYFTKNDRYKIKAHFVTQDLLNEENGGLSFVPPTDVIGGLSGIEQYLTLDPEEQDDFKDRGSITVNFEDAESILLGKRFYLHHQYAIINKKDSSTTALSVGHILDITDKSFQFDQATANALFGESFQASALSDKVSLEDFTNQVFIDFHNPWVGNLNINVGTSNYNYGYNSILRQIDDLSGEETNITNRIKGDIYSVGASYNKNYKGFQLSANARSILSGGFGGNYLNAAAGYHLNSKYGASVSIHSNSVAPNYNFLLYQSNYENYNWQNFNNENEEDNFKNIETQKIQFNINAKKFANLEASYTKIDNYTYFTKNTDSITVPLQFDRNVDLLKLKLSQTLNFGWIGIDNTVLYQDVSKGDEVYNVPKIVTRNSIYYQDHWFKKALFLQTGVTFKYYSQYTADGYDPVLSEFYVQSEAESAFFEQENHTFGGFPQFDIFINAKIRQTRLYFKVENFGEAFHQNNEFSAPGYAPRDAVIRFGLVWNFFL